MVISDFKDEEDKQLVQLVKRFLDAGKEVCWETIEIKMKHAKKSKNVLRGRLKILKRIHQTNDANLFPKRFLRLRSVNQDPSALARHLLKAAMLKKTMRACHCCC